MMVDGFFSFINNLDSFCFDCYYLLLCLIMVDDYVVFFLILANNVDDLRFDSTYGTSSYYDYYSSL